MPDTPVRPTRVRYVIVLLTTLIAVLLYIDRNCLSFLGPYIAEDAGLSAAQLSILLSSFYWTYAITQVPAGWLCDGFGARLVLTIFLAGWSLCTGFMGLVYGLFLLLTLRLACGLFQAGAYPTAAGLIRHWVPFHQRGFASGVVSIGGRLGGAVMPPLTAFLLVSFVPPSAPSTLSAADVPSDQRLRLTRILNNAAANLFDGARTARDAEEKGRLVVVQRFVDRLPGAAKAAVRSFAFLGNENHVSDERFADTVLKGLNEVIGARDLLESQADDTDAKLAFEELKVPAEAERLLSRSSADLTQQEVERRNRLLLETVLPGVVRKVYGAAWRPVVLVYAAAGLLLALVFWWYFRDSPREHSGVNAAEIELIQPAALAARPITAGAPPLPWRQFLTNRSLWLISIVQFLTNLGWTFLVTLFPVYLLREHRVTVEEGGWMAGVPLFVGIAGMFLGGWLTDWTTRRLGVRLGRLLPLSLSRFLVAAAFFACMVMDSPWPITIAMALVALGVDLGVPATWAFCLDVGGKNTAAVLGWGNMWGNIGSAVSPVLLQAIASDMGYEAMFATCGLVFVLAGVLSLGVDATSRVAAEG
ncbi:MAG: MFS transporter [Gemmataceae bacterium]